MRNPYIDRLRGLSIAAVLMLHCAVNLPSDFRPIPHDFFFALVRTGYYGVSMFFVISGFLITGKVLQRELDERNPRFSIKAFYAQRLGRIFPVLALMVFIAVALSLIGVQGFIIDQTHHSILQILNYVFTFRFNMYLVPGLPLPWLVLWSLSIEEVFYLSFPILFGALKKPRWIVPILIAVIVFGPFRRASSPPRWLYDYFSCFDLISIGSLTAFISSALSRLENRQKIWKLFRWTGLAIITFVYLRYPVLQNIVFGPSLIGIGAAVYLLGSAYPKAVPSIAARVLRLPELFGQFSYELYLFHSFVIVAVAGMIAPAVIKTWNLIALSYGSFGVAIAVSFLVSAGIAKAYSEPANKCIRRMLSASSDRREPSRPLPAGCESALPLLTSDDE
jgi:peptidoglycan/LPS O-acetylase OafA/YrhL